MALVVICVSARKAWNTLKTMHAEPHVANHMHRYEKLLKVWLENGNNVCIFLHDTARARTQPRTVNVENYDMPYQLELQLSWLRRPNSPAVNLGAQKNSMVVKNDDCVFWRGCVRRHLLIMMQRHFTCTTMVVDDINRPVENCLL